MARQTKNGAHGKVDPSSEATKLETETGFPSDSIEAKILRLRARVPYQEWEKVPRDGSYNLDHYLYGAPKKA